MTTTNGRLRAALYFRVSKDEQAKHGYSIPDQRRVLREHAAREGWRVVEEYEDDGYSGGDPHRPGLRRVMELAAEGAIDVVLATKRDRFFRSRLYRLLTERDLSEMGVGMVALNDTGNRIGDGVQDDFAEFEREQIRERTMRGIREKVRSGKVLRSSFPAPYGFEYSADGSSLEVHEPEMAVLRRLFRGLAEGRTGRQVTTELETQGIASPGGLLRWNQTTVRNLLFSPLYRPLVAEEAAGMVAPEVAATLDPRAAYGLWTYGKRETSRRREWDPERGKFVTHHKARARPEGERLAVPVGLDGSGLERRVVDRAREQAADRSRKPSTAGGRFWVLKSVLRCAECGCSISPHTVKRYRKDGTPRKPSFYYQCRQKYHDGPRECSNIRSFPAEPLEHAVWDRVRDLIRDPSRVQRAYEKEIERLRRGHRDDPGREAAVLADRLRDIEAERRGYQRLAARGSMDDDELDAALAGLDGQRREAEVALEEARGRGDRVEALRRDLAHLWVRFEQIRTDELRFLDPEDKRKVLRAARATAEIDREGNVRISSMLNLDVTEF